jgi:hypothetical protein
MEIKIGSNIAVEVLKLPRNVAGKKTLVRLFRRDPEIARHHRHQHNKRPSWEAWRRGGKMWHHQMKSETTVSLEKGRTYNLRATLDVIRDLASVGDCVKVTQT